MTYLVSKIVRNVLLMVWLIFFTIHIPASAQESFRPNVVIILADDMGYGDVSALNPEAKTYTPFIDQLIDQGITFTDAHASASVCTPSRYGLLTGRYAWRKEGTGVVNGFEGPVMDMSRSTLGDKFREAGYSTACVGKWHLGLGWQTTDGEPAVQNRTTGRSNVDYSKPVLTGPVDFGFEYSFIHPASLDMPPYLFLENQVAVDSHMVLTSEIYQENLKNTVYSWDKKHTKPGDVYWRKGVWWRKGEIAQSFRLINCLPEIAEKGREFMMNHKFTEGATTSRRTKPFFLYLPLTAPHTPWITSPQFQGKSSMGDYGDFVMQVDGVVGQVVETLRQMGEWENTILIFSSDNGAYCPEEEIALTHHHSNTGRRGQKGDVWDGGHRVPLVITWPKQIRTSKTYEGLTSLTDFYVTLAALLGHKMDAEEGEDSYSFLPLLLGDDLESHRPSMVHRSSEGLFGYRKGEWKYIDGLGSGGFSIPKSMEPEAGGPTGKLYNMEHDPLESNNLFLQEKTRADRMKHELQMAISGSGPKDQ